MGPLHIVALRFSSLGDVVLQTSLLKSLKRRWGDRVHLTLLTSKAFTPLVEGCSFVDSVQVIERISGVKGLVSLHRLVKNLHRQRKIHLILDLHATLRAWFIRLAFPHIARIGADKRTLERWLLCGLKLDLLSFQGPAGREKGYGEPLLARTVNDFKAIFDLSVVPATRPWSGITQHDSEEDLNISHWSKAFTAKRFVLLVPSASFPEKRWPLSSFLKLAELFLSGPDWVDWGLVVTAGAQDDFCRAFNSLEKRYPQRFANLQGQTSLHQSALLAKKAQLCVGNDTGLPHIAEAVGTQALVILGPTGEQFGFYPHLKNSRVLFKNLWCRPCTTNGKGTCIRSERFCLTLITPEQVHQTMKEMVGHQ